MFPIKRTIQVYGFYYYSIVFGLYNNIAVIYYIINNKIPPFSLFIFCFISVSSYYLISLFCLYKKYELYRFLYVRYFHFFGLIFYLSFYSIIFYPIYYFSNFRTKTYILIYTLPALICVLYGIINERLLYPDRHRIKIKGIKKEIKLIHLSDLHLGAAYGKNEVEKLVKMILKEKGDLIVITGETKLSHTYTLKSSGTPLSKDSLLTQLQVKHLKNENIIFNDCINIIGKEYEFNIEKAKKDIKELIPNNNLPNILLYHSPIFELEELPNLNINLYLCGHLHGGQMFPYDNIKHMIYYKRYKGLFSIKDNFYLYLVSGIGTSVPLLRTLSAPNFGVITLN